MSFILNIETATKNCSVSIAKDGVLVNLLEINDGKFSHAEKLHVLIKEILADSKIELKELDAIAISKGPGSYTGLRIGVSTAKGFCFALEKPLISVPTLTSLANAVQIDNGLIIPLLDARRMEVYSAVFNNKHEKIRKTLAEIIEANSFNDYLENGKVYFIGDGALKCKAVIKHKNAVFIDYGFPSAKEMVSLSYKKMIAKDFENIAYFEPFYLKDFVATPPKRKFS